MGEQVSAVPRAKGSRSGPGRRRSEAEGKIYVRTSRNASSEVRRQEEAPLSDEIYSYLRGAEAKGNWPGDDSSQSPPLDKDRCLARLKTRN